MADPVTIYALYSTENLDQILYIGQTRTTLKKKLSNHKSKLSIAAKKRWANKKDTQ